MKREKNSSNFISERLSEVLEELTPEQVRSRASLAYILALHKNRRAKGDSRKPLDEAVRDIRAFAGRGSDGE